MVLYKTLFESGTVLLASQGLFLYDETLDSVLCDQLIVVTPSRIELFHSSESSEKGERDSQIFSLGSMATSQTLLAACVVPGWCRATGPFQRPLDNAVDLLFLVSTDYNYCLVRLGHDLSFLYSEVLLKGTLLVPEVLQYPRGSVIARAAPLAEQDMEVNSSHHVLVSYLLSAEAPLALLQFTFSGIEYTVSQHRIRLEDAFTVHKLGALTMGQIPVSVGPQINKIVQMEFLPPEKTGSTLSIVFLLDTEAGLLGMCSNLCTDEPGIEQGAWVVGGFSSDVTHFVAGCPRGVPYAATFVSAHGAQCIFGAGRSASAHLEGAAPLGSVHIAQADDGFCVSRADGSLSVIRCRVPHDFDATKGELQLHFEHVIQKETCHLPRATSMAYLCHTNRLILGSNSSDSAVCSLAVAPMAPGDEFAHIVCEPREMQFIECIGEIHDMLSLDPSGIGRDIVITASGVDHDGALSVGYPGYRLAPLVDDGPVILGRPRMRFIASAHASAEIEAFQLRFQLKSHRFRSSTFMPQSHIDDLMKIYQSATSSQVREADHVQQGAAAVAVAYTVAWDQSGRQPTTQSGEVFGYLVLSSNDETDYGTTNVHKIGVSLSGISVCQVTSTMFSRLHHDEHTLLVRRHRPGSRHLGALIQVTPTCIVRATFTEEQVVTAAQFAVTGHALPAVSHGYTFFEGSSVPKLTPTASASVSPSTSYSGAFPHSTAHFRNAAMRANCLAVTIGRFIWLLNAETLEPVAGASIAHSRDIPVHMALSPDASVLFAATIEGQLIAFSTEPFAELFRMQLPCNVPGSSILVANLDPMHPESPFLIVGQLDGHVQVTRLTEDYCGVASPTIGARIGETAVDLTDLGPLETPMAALAPENDLEQLHTASHVLCVSSRTSVVFFAMELHIVPIASSPPRRIASATAFCVPEFIESFCCSRPFERLRGQRTGDRFWNRDMHVRRIPPFLCLQETSDTEHMAPLAHHCLQFMAPLLQYTLNWRRCYLEATPLRLTYSCALRLCFVLTVSAEGSQIVAVDYNTLSSRVVLRLPPRKHVLALQCFRAVQESASYLALSLMEHTGSQPRCMLSFYRIAVDSTLAPPSLERANIIQSTQAAARAGRRFFVPPLAQKDLVHHTWHDIEAGAEDSLSAQRLSSFHFDHAGIYPLNAPVYGLDISQDGHLLCCMLDTVVELKAFPDTGGVMSRDEVVYESDSEDMTPCPVADDSGPSNSESFETESHMSLTQDISSDPSHTPSLSNFTFQPRGHNFHADPIRLSLKHMQAFSVTNQGSLLVHVSSQTQVPSGGLAVSLHASRGFHLDTPPTRDSSEASDLLEPFYPQYRDFILVESVMGRLCVMQRSVTQYVPYALDVNNVAQDSIASLLLPPSFVLTISQSNVIRLLRIDETPTVFQPTCERPVCVDGTVIDIGVSQKGTPLTVRPFTVVASARLPERTVCALSSCLNLSIHTVPASFDIAPAGYFPNAESKGICVLLGFKSGSIAMVQQSRSVAAFRVLQHLIAELDKHTTFQLGLHQAGPWSHRDRWHTDDNANDIIDCDTVASFLKLPLSERESICRAVNCRVRDIILTFEDALSIYM